MRAQAADGWRMGARVLTRRLRQEERVARLRLEWAGRRQMQQVGRACQLVVLKVATMTPICRQRLQSNHLTAIWRCLMLVLTSL